MDEIVVLTLDIDDDDTVVLRRSVEPATSPSEPQYVASVSESTIASRFRRKQAAIQLGAQRSLQVLKFFTGKSKSMNWKAVERNFERLSKDKNGYIDRSDFPECIGMKDSKEFALEMFDAFNRTRRSKVEKFSKEELFEYWSRITDESFDNRLAFFFSMVDKNEDGHLSEKEVEEILLLSASANKLSMLTKEQVAEYAGVIMEALDPEDLGYIGIRQLEELLLQKDNYESYRQALLSQNSQRYKRPMQIRMSTKALYFLKDNWRRIWVLMLWVMIMAVLFTWKFIEYKKKSAFKVMGYCLTTAKGAGETLKFNMALILLPVCRNTITWLRSTKLAYIIPFNDNINFHKTIAGGILIGVILHVGSHLTCDFVRLERSSSMDYNRYLGDDFGQPKPSYADLLRGYEGVTGIIMVVLMALASTLATHHLRRGDENSSKQKQKQKQTENENSKKVERKPFDKLTGYNAFWYSHHLFIIVYIMLIIHGLKLYLVHDWHLKTTWMYIAVPVLLYTGERLLRFFRSELCRVEALEAAIYPGGVLKLQISKPPNFRYRSGQYVFVNCPEVSIFEWHPFSITSAPGDDFLSVHIRNLGDWTNGINKLFTEVRKTIVIGNSERPTASRNSFPKVLIDGPYGAPAQDYREYDVLLLVGMGIGATPLISIVKDLLNNTIKQEEDEEMVTGSCPMKTKHAYFYWVTREQGSFEWFKGVINEVAEIDHRGIIEMHNHLTSVHEEGDAQSALISIAQALNHAKNGVDIVSGTRARTYFARPNWKKVFFNLNSEHPNARIGVFNCGSPQLADELRELCFEYSQIGITKFKFHKENF